MNICVLVASPLLPFLMMVNNCLEKFPGRKLVGQRGMNILMASDIDEAILLSNRVKPICNAIGNVNVSF